MSGEPPRTKGAKSPPVASKPAKRPRAPRAGKLSDEDLMLRRAVLATGSLRFAASLLGCLPPSVGERMRRCKKVEWWRGVKAEWAIERRSRRPIVGGHPRVRCAVFPLHPAVPRNVRQCSAGDAR